MKRICIPFLIVLWNALFQQAFAQPCVPDPIYTSPGIYPATLPNACAGEFYEANVTIVVPVDTLITNPIPLTVPIDSIVLLEAIGLPSGLSIACNPGSCGFPGGGAGCVNLSGTPTVGGSYPLDLSIVVYVNLFGTVVPFPDTLLGYYTLSVGDSITVSTTSTPANCAATDGTASVSILGGTAPISILWSTGDTTATIDNLAAGSYSVAVTDAFGCGFSGSVTVGSLGQGATIDSAATVIEWEGCGDEDLGLISPQVTGGTAPYSYLWTNGDTSLVADSLAAGSYTLTVTDSSGCAISQTYEVEAPALIVMNAVRVDSVSCAGAEDGFIEVAVSGGVDPLAFQWEGLTGETTSSLDNVGADTYTLIVEDANGCIDSSSYEVLSPDSLLLSLSGVDQSTPGAADGSAVATPSGGTPPYEYAWNTGGTSDTLSGLEAGVYSVIVTDANGCETEAEIELSTITAVDASWLRTIEVFPNPISQELRIELELAEPGSYQLEVYALQGQLMRREMVSATTRSTHRWEVQEWPAGLYLLQLSHNGKRWTQKLMKQ
jgi:hypothetical protein